jgi:Flp pilus assembly protein TadG
MTTRRLRRDSRGVTSLEFGLMAVPLTLLLFGVIELGMVIRAKSALQFAATNAARCAVVNQTTCGTVDATKAYALTQTQGVQVAASAFTVTTEGCGKKVVASMALPVIAASVLNSGLTLSAQACYPLHPA